MIENKTKSNLLKPLKLLFWQTLLRNLENFGEVVQVNDERVLTRRDEELENGSQENLESEHCTKIDIFFISS